MNREVIVKFGPKANRTEACVLSLVKNKTAVPVPEMRAVHEDEDGNTYIVMDETKGHSLASVWDSLTLAQKEKLVVQLRGHMTTSHRQ